MLPRVGVNLVPLPPRLMLPGARLIEELGYDSVWIGEHVIVPPVIESVYPAGVNAQPFDVASAFMEPMIVLAHVAAVTKSIRLGVGIWLMPLRHPVMTAKSFATLDQLSGGRVELGVGVGWMKEEFDVLGVDYARRGAMTDDGLAVMSQLLAPGEAPISTPHFTLPAVGLYPKPVDGAIRSKVIGGGYSPRAWQRAMGLDGWYGHLSRVGVDASREGSFSAAAVRDFVRTMRSGREKLGRDPAGFEISGAVRSATAEELEELATLGVDRVVVNPWGFVGGTHVGIATTLDPVASYAESIGLSGTKQP